MRFSEFLVENRPEYTPHGALSDIKLAVNRAFRRGSYPTLGGGGQNSGVDWARVEKHGDKLVLSGQYIGEWDGPLENPNAQTVSRQTLSTLEKIVAKVEADRGVKITIKPDQNAWIDFVVDAHKE